MTSRLFTSESVTEGHPDKICDAISDSILDELLRQDPSSRVAVETMVTTGQVHVAGEVTTSAYADIPAIVRDTVLGIGYDSSAKGFDGASCGVNVAIGAQSPDIAQGVDTAFEARTHSPEEIDDHLSQQGAGDQGLMFGYACTDTPELMPLPIALAHRLARGLTGVRKSGAVPYLRPDGKTQVTIEYDGDKAVRLDTVVVSTQHAENIDLEQLLAVDVREQVVEPELAALEIDTTGYRLLVNPTGRFVIGGPMGDAGADRPQDHRRHLRRHGPARRRRLLRQGPVEGGPVRRPTRCAGWPRTWWPRVWPTGSRCRSPTRSARPRRWACSWRPSAPSRWTRTRSPRRSRQVFDLRPAAIIRDLDLKRPIYAQTAAYGHFGRTDVDLPWESTERAADLKSALGI